MSHWTLFARATRTAAYTVCLAVGGRRLDAQSPRIGPGGLPPHACADTAARLDSALRGFAARERIPGLSVAIVHRGVLLCERGYGLADLEQRVQATPATRYRVASMSKAITTVAVLQLVEHGALDLDAPIQRYVPAFPAKRYPVTVRALLAATSGVRGYQGDESLSARSYPTLAASLPIFRDDSLRNAPGVGYIETPYGFTLLGLAVEAVTGTPFVDALRDRLLLPAGMTATRADINGDIIPGRARAYSRDSTGAVRNAIAIDPSYKMPAGGLLSTAGDMAQFGAALLDGKLILPASLKAMTTPVQLASGQVLPLGWGVALGDAGGGWGARPDAVWLAGLQEGATGVVYLLPRERLVIAVLTNLNGARGGDAVGLLKHLAATTAAIGTDLLIERSR